MASYNELNALIDAYINRNGVQAITGQILNGVLKAMVEQLGRGYTIMGAATPTTDPGTPDGPECYFASETGTYTDFDGLQVVPGELALLCYTPADGWTKATIYEGFRQVGATIDGNVGTPSVGVSYANGVLSFDFHNMKGNPGQNGRDGQNGAAAGFGTIGADITGGVGTPGVSVESSGPATAKNLQFHFTNLKGETGVTSVVATVDNTTGTPACTVSLVGQQLTLAFSGLKGAQGDTGSSVDYPFTIVNNLTTDDATQALSAAQGVVLDGKVTQLEAKVDGLRATLQWTLTAHTVNVETQSISLNKDEEYTFTVAGPLSSHQMQIVYSDNSTEYWQLPNGETKRTFAKDITAIRTFMSNPASSGTLTINVAGPSPLVSKSEYNAKIEEIESNIEGLTEDVEDFTDFKDESELILKESEKVLSWNVTQGTVSIEDRPIKILAGTYFTILRNDLLSSPGFRFVYIDDTIDNFTLGYAKPLQFYAKKEIKAIRTYMGSPTATGTLTITVEIQSLISERDKARIVIPSKMYAVVGEEFNLYYDCIGLTAPGATEDFCPYLFDVECSIGGCGVKSYRVTPTETMLNSGNPKEYPFVLTLMDNFGNVIEQHTSSIVVVPRRIQSANIGYMPIGDSNTAGFSYAPKHIQNLLDTIDNGKVTEVGFMGYINRSLAGSNQYYAHTGISGASMGTFTGTWQSGVNNNYYKCAITGYNMNAPRDADNVKNLTQNKQYTVVEYELDGNGSGYVVLSSALSNPAPVVGDYVWVNNTQVTKFTVTSVVSLASLEILKTNGEYDWPEFISRNSIPQQIDIISIDLGINDCGQGNASVYRESTVFDNFVNGCKAIVDSFLEYNPDGYVILCLPKSPAASRCSKCQDGYRVNLQNLRKRILAEFDNGAYNSHILISHCGLAIDRRLGYWVASEFNGGNEIYASSFFEGATPVSTFKYNPDNEGFHPAERGYKQVAYAMAGAILYADYLMSQS